MVIFFGEAKTRLMVKSLEGDILMINKVKSFLFSYSAAIITMSIIFIITDYNQEDRFDIAYFAYGLLHMIFLGIPAGVIGLVLFRIYAVLKIVIGIIVGPITAALYIYVTLFILESSLLISICPK